MTLSPTKMMLAVTALLDALGDGAWHDAGEIRAELERDGLGRDVAYRAARACRVETRQIGSRAARRSEWRIAPGTPPPAPEAVDRRLRARPRPPLATSGALGADAVCRLCRRSLEGRHLKTAFCTVECKAEAARIRRILTGERTGPRDYHSLAERLAAEPRPGGPLSRLLNAAGLERPAPTP